MYLVTLHYYLAVDGAGVEEDVQKCGVSEVPQARDTGQGECLQLTSGEKRTFEHQRKWCSRVQYNTCTCIMYMYN